MNNMKGYNLYKKEIKDLEIGDVFINKFYGEVTVKSLKAPHERDTYKDSGLDIKDNVYRHFTVEDNISGTKHVFPMFIDKEGNDVESTNYKCSLIQKIHFATEKLIL